MAQRIEVVRGTTNTFEISIVDSSGAPYNLGSNERIVFGIKRNPEREEVPLVVKTAEIIGAGLVSVKLLPEDTASLGFGKHYYGVSLETGVDFFSVIEPSPFMIVANVTHRGCDT